MTKAELIDIYWHDFLVWCATSPESGSDLTNFWLNHRQPTEDNFWEYLVEVRGGLDDDSR